MTAGLPTLDCGALVAAGRMLPVPFTLVLRVAEGNFGEATSAAARLEIECREIMRLLPSRRLVARVHVAGREAVLKLFLGKQAQRYCDREAEGCGRLAAAGIATPDLLGRVSEDSASRAARGLLFEYLPAAHVLRADDQPGIEAAAAHLARLHDAGSRHRDLHLDNFLCSAGAVYMIDGDGVRGTLRGTSVRRRASLADLGVLCAQRPPSADVGLPAVFRAYAVTRGWRLPVPVQPLARTTRLARRERLRRYLHKAQRDCSEFCCTRTWRHYVVAVRAAWDPDLAAFAADPEAAFRSARVLKAGNSATVIRAEVGARRCVVKRYNVKGPWHALRRSLRIIPRFRRSWLNGQRLHLLAIPTARPLALVERRWGPWRGVAYLVMEDLSDPGVGGPRDLAEEVRSGVAAERVDQVVALFQALQVGELSHGDTKATNFLVDAHDRLCLIDLDAMRSGRRALAGDVARFLDNFAGRPALRRRYAEALRAAGLPGTE